MSMTITARESVTPKPDPSASSVGGEKSEDAAVVPGVSVGECEHGCSDDKTVGEADP